MLTELENGTACLAREAFEAWARSRGMYAARREGDYPDSAARFAWDVWNASWHSQHALTDAGRRVDRAGRNEDAN